MIGKYGRREAVLSLDAAKKIAKAFGITLDYLSRETTDMNFDRSKIERIEDIGKLSESEKDHTARRISHKEHDAGDTQINQQRPIFIGLGVVVKIISLDDTISKWINIV